MKTILTGSNFEHLKRTVKYNLIQLLEYNSSGVYFDRHFPIAAQVVFTKMFPSKDWEGVTSQNVFKYMRRIENCTDKHLCIVCPEIGLSDSQKVIFMQWLLTVRPDLHLYIITQSTICILAARLSVKNGEIPLTDLKFLFNDEECALTSEGRFESYPEGFFDVYPTLLAKLAHNTNPQWKAPHE